MFTHTELSSLVDTLDTRARKEADESGHKGGRYRKKTRRISTPSTLLTPQAAPDWSVQSSDIVNDNRPVTVSSTPQGDTGVGNSARRQLYSAHEIINEELSP